MATPTFANIMPTGNRSDGLPYATGVVLTQAEADLYNGPTLQNIDPIPVIFGQGVQAVVTLTPSGAPASVNCYVVMQTDLGDGVWVDIAWCVYTNTQAVGVFVLSAGVAANNAFQQSRQAGAFPNPQTTGINACILGGRVRFVGKAILTGTSSSAPGSLFQMAATIRYKMFDPR